MKHSKKGRGGGTKSVPKDSPGKLGDTSQRLNNVSGSAELGKKPSKKGRSY